MGYTLNIFGILLAYLIKGKNRNKRIKYAWIGLGVAVVATGIFYLLFLNEFKIH